MQNKTPIPAALQQTSPQAKGTEETSKTISSRPARCHWLVLVTRFIASSRVGVHNPLKHSAVQRPVDSHLIECHQAAKPYLVFGLRMLECKAMAEPYS